MKKIIVDPNDYQAIEVKLNNSLAPRRGLTSHAYHQLVIVENFITIKLTRIFLARDLPKLVTLLSEIDPEFQSEELQQRINETLNVLRKVIHLMLDGFHIVIINSILDITTGHGGYDGPIFMERFYPLGNQAVREDFWGTKWQLPCFITKGLLEDILNGIDIDNPTAEDLKKSKVVEVAKIYQCPQETIDAFIASYQA